MAEADLKSVFQKIGLQDRVEYFLFLPKDIKNISEYMLEVNAVAQDLIGDYMWHQETFILRQPTTEEVAKFDAAILPNMKFLYGSTQFGDNVEDEWFIVHVLLHLTTRFPDIVVRVIDNDGEFLLIEAADFLPDWAESDESCAQRVYLYNGAVHLIPRKTGPLPDGVPEISDAVKAVRSHPNKSVCPENIQSCILKRIGNYPSKMEENFHYANLMLPPKLAAIIQQDPNLVPYGVATFYFRDPIDIKASRLFKTFKPREGLVKSRVKFTRCLYAMLYKQNFRPDPKSGWTFPSPASSEFKAHTLGAKLTLGFEILASRLIGSLGNPQHTETFEDNAGWLRYEQSLKKTGYFKDYLEGSRPYSQLAEKAKSFFNDNLTEYVRLEHEDVMLKHFKNIYNNISVDIEKLKTESKSQAPDDDDSWMEIRPEDFDKILETHFQTQGSSLSSKEIPKKLREFMNKISDFEGVELSDESKPPRKDEVTNGGTNENELEEMLEPLDFRADEFVSAMDKLLLDLGQRDQDWDASDDSYGSEDEFDMNLEDIKNMHKSSKIAAFMGQMDAELAETEVGKTFKNAPGPSSAAGTRKRTKVSGSATTTAVEELEEFDDVEAVEPYDVDMNTLSNMLESFRSQEGPSGPSANLLRSVGININDLKQ
ncbi:unnamed protein product [Orchesella dallaii]|uniref:Protein ecdysoneless n=1 Tax=Orchesella dallaii TaxID=48710 RepID=A0ABP1R824_9HEXA